MLSARCVWRGGCCLVGCLSMRKMSRGQRVQMAAMSCHVLLHLHVCVEIVCACTIEFHTMDNAHRRMDEQRIGTCLRKGPCAKSSRSTDTCRNACCTATCTRTHARTHTHTHTHTDPGTGNNESLRQHRAAEQCGRKPVRQHFRPAAKHPAAAAAAAAAATTAATRPRPVWWQHSAIAKQPLFTEQAPRPRSESVWRWRPDEPRPVPAAAAGPSLRHLGVCEHSHSGQQ